ncbi:SDR family NAD(P)-dependent oxidoreductase [Jiangella asiatica]|uniref:SDR family oxidoreductase n=1 Tax=Jiangella asiatica TaxID=2530372 RepID=A0A4R5D5W3_9ACTN|nr:SDR family oxidoreductase [Jiangella asiatica]TDE08756.1 SDR family oxidoreductase [Jiangella asiatica]
MRVVVVTGGGAGIGRAAVERFANDGELVVALDRDAAALDDLAGRAADAGWTVRTQQLDVADDVAVGRRAAELAEEFETIDALVCAAGIQRYGTVEETSMELFDEVVGVNLRGVFATCHHLMPLLRADGGGSVVVVSSIQAYASQSGVAAYAATKGALLALVRSMAVDHARDGVRVNAVCPGSVDTPMLRWAAELFSDGRPADDVVAEWGRTHPLGRVARPGEVADAIAYLAGPQASFVTGTELVVDGGVRAALGVALPESTGGN